MEKRHAVCTRSLFFSCLARASSEDTNCALETFQDDPYITRYLQGLIQLLNWWGVGFFLYSFPCCAKNVVLLMIMLVGASYINAHFTHVLVKMDPNRIFKSCFEGLVLFVVVVCAAEGVVLLLLGYEHDRSRRSCVERHVLFEFANVSIIRGWIHRISS